MTTLNFSRNPTMAGDTLDGRTASYYGGNPVACYFWVAKDGDPSGFRGFRVSDGKYYGVKALANGFYAEHLIK